MIGPATERGGLKESENAPNSIFPKINRTGFWRFGTDMYAIFTPKWGLKDILFLDPYGRLTPHGGGNVHFIFLSASWKKCSCHGKAGGIYKRGERDFCIELEMPRILCQKCIKNKKTNHW